jgi:hypothetical protein
MRIIKKTVLLLIVLALAVGVFSTTAIAAELPQLAGEPAGICLIASMPEYGVPAFSRSASAVGGPILVAREWPNALLQTMVNWGW